jgi:hypothetical protein
LENLILRFEELQALASLYVERVVSGFGNEKATVDAG